MKCMVNFEGISRISCALCGLVSRSDLCLIGNHLESIFSWNMLMMLVRMVLELRNWFSGKKHVGVFLL